MHYLIDGHNVIAKMADISLADPGDEVKLVLRLKSWAAGGRNRRVTVIFDGGLPGGRAPRLSSSTVTVLFAPPGKTADSLLIHHIRRVKNPPEYTLVSSDRQVIAAAEAKRMRYWRAGEFAERLAAQNERHRPEKQTTTSATSEREEPHLSQTEIEEWLELFGPEPESTPAKPKKVQRDRSIPDAKRNKAASSSQLSPEEAKTVDRKLNPDEVAEWLKFFGDENET
jgi:predicted RNA-binding protein with PIN domain